ncbi:SPFH domain-containing protein [Actinoplanes auranticolor]|uniref:Band 7 domain-containing protein n=1 Tax=Actinoplanes auranticolor TaxID=47988 RepID=A0A919T0D6_9ACTN|nr:SPFH domain-containing protein [Actinoplanes auranticolor]GIM80528.1 hypothetical protein Aau02nite_91000 [Actinoplanes auranticolor]
MWSLWIALLILVHLALAFLAVKVVKQYEQGVLFRLGKVIAVRKAGLTVIIPFVDVLNRVSLRIGTMPMVDKRAEPRAYVRRTGEDLPEIRDRTWTRTP